MCAERLGIGRDAQDEHAISSVERARAAVAAGEGQGLLLGPLSIAWVHCLAHGAGMQLGYRFPALDMTRCGLLPCVPSLPPPQA